MRDILKGANRQLVEILMENDHKNPINDGFFHKEKAKKEQKASK